MEWPHNLQKRRWDELTFIVFFMFLFVCVVHLLLKPYFRGTGNSCNDMVFCFLLLSKHKISVFDLYLFTRPFISQTKEENMIKGHWNMWALGALGGISLYDRELKRFQQPSSLPGVWTHVLLPIHTWEGCSGWGPRHTSLAPEKSPLQPEDSLEMRGSYI